MYEVKYVGIITNEKYKKQIFDLMVLCDKAFIPPLSSRNSSSQKDLLGHAMSEEGPVAYYQEMIQQHFILAFDKDDVVGFMTFKPDFACLDYPHTIYATTSIVNPKYRGNHFLSRFYEVLESGLPDNIRQPYITLRTWSGNEKQFYMLDKRGYKKIKTIPDDRGPNIDTVYFMKEIKE